MESAQLAKKAHSKRDEAVIEDRSNAYMAVGIDADTAAVRRLEIAVEEMLGHEPLRHPGFTSGGGNQYVQLFLESGEWLAMLHYSYKFFSPLTTAFLKKLGDEWGADVVERLRTRETKTALDPKKIEPVFDELKSLRNSGHRVEMGVPSFGGYGTNNIVLSLDKVSHEEIARVSVFWSIFAQEIAKQSEIYSSQGYAVTEAQVSLQRLSVTLYLSSDMDGPELKPLILTFKVDAKGNVTFEETYQ